MFDKEGFPLYYTNTDLALQILEAMPDPVIAIDRDYRITSFNPGMQKEIFRIFSTDIKLGDNLYDILDKRPDLYDEISENWTRVLKGQQHTKELYIIYKNGGYNFLRRNYSPLINENGEIYGAFSLGRTITSEERWNLALSGSGSGVWDWNLKTKQMFFSNQWKKQLGYSEDDVFNSKKSWESLLHPADKAKAITSIDNYVQGFSPFYKSEYRLRCADNTYKWFLDKGKIIEHDDNGKAIRFVATLTDITDIKKQELALKGSQKIIDSFIENLPIGLLNFDAFGVLHQVNDAIIKILGLNNPEFWLNKYSIYKEKRRFKEITDFFKKAIDEKRSLQKDFSLDWRHLPENPYIKRKEILDVAITAFPVFDNDGFLTSLFALVQDVSEKKQEELELIKSQNLMKEAGNLAKIGGWEYLVKEDKLIYSDEIYRMMKIPDNFKPTIDWAKKHYLPESRIKLEVAFNECIEKGKPFDKELSAKSFTNELHWIRVLGVPEYRDGKVCRIYGLFQDLTDAVNIKNELHTNTQLLNYLFESVDLIYAVLDKYYRFTYLNLKAEKVFGKQAKKGYSIFEIFPKITTDSMGKAIQKVKKTRKSQVVEYYHSYDGNWYELNIHPTNDEGVQIFAKNISERKYLQKELFAVNRQLIDLNDYLTNQNSQLEEFAQIISHNLRAPIANLNALKKFHEDADLNDKQFYLDMMDQSIKNISETLNDLVDVIQVRKDIHLEKETVSFASVLKKTMGLLAADIEAKKAIVSFDFSAVPEINYFRIYMESIFQNLLSNALKYAAPDRIPNINIKTTIFENQIQLIFTDNGLGIDLERNGDKIFGFKKTFHRNNDAKGLGLFITKNQVEAMNGKIEVLSEVNIGTKFMITF